MWSERCERLLLKHSLTLGGDIPRGRRFRGRVQHIDPVLRDLAPPRFKQGRNGDFCVNSASNCLEVRQVQKQARRLQALMRTLSCSLFGPTQRSKCEELWAAIVRSGFRPNFPRWAWNELGLDIVYHLDVDSLSTLVDKVYEHANKLASARWRAKKTEFTVQIENSWKTKEGRMPFAMLRERPLPPVTDLRFCLDVKLAPQR